MGGYVSGFGSVLSPDPDMPQNLIPPTMPVPPQNPETPGVRLGFTGREEKARETANHLA